MTTRREFLTAGAALAAVGAVPVRAAEKPEAIKAFLLHLGRNMWGWTPPEDLVWDDPKRKVAATRLECVESIWRANTAHMAARGLNMLVIDLGEGLAYPSHPELGVEGSWSPDKMRDEVARLRAMGIEAIPKLNFSTTHNAWLKDYRGMLATKTYYRVCEDVIRDVAEIFGHPRFFHMGFDEETSSHQENSPRNLAVVVRKGTLWWHDFLHVVKTCERHGMRPWCWSDYGWHHPEYFKRCPKSVLQSNWYYDEADGDFSLDDKVNRDAFRLREFVQLEEAGFDQVPCGTNWVGWMRKKREKNADDVIGRVIKFCRERVAPERLKGFLMAPWAMCDSEESNTRNVTGIDLFADALNAPRA